MKQFYEIYRDDKKLSAMLRELGWTKNMLIFSKSSSRKEREFYIQLCLVAFELKIDEFKPEYLGKLSFYQEALDRDIKKPHENPSIGIILCKGKDDDVVEYALSRSLSPAAIADYTTKLPDKRLLQEKLNEFFDSSVHALGGNNGDRKF